MNGTDWLRSLVRRKPRYATGGIITADQAPILGESGCTYTVPATMPKHELPPGVTVTLHPDSTPTPELIQQMVEALGVDPTKTAELPQRIPPSREHTAELTRQAAETARAERVLALCPCIAIYSRCYCKRRS